MACNQELNQALSSTSMPLIEKLAVVEKAFLGSEHTFLSIENSLVLWFINNYKNDKIYSENVLLSFINILKIQRGEAIQALSTSSLSSIYDFIFAECSSKSISNKFVEFINAYLNMHVSSNYLLQNDKKAADLFAVVVPHLNLETENEIQLFSAFNALYQSLSHREKAVAHFITKATLALAPFYHRVSSNKALETEKQKVVIFCHHLYFGRGRAAKLTRLLQNIFEKKTDTDMKVQGLIKILQECSESSIKTDEKASLFKLIFEAFLSTERLDDVAVIRFTIFISHLLNIEQKVQVALEEERFTLVDAELLSNRIPVSHCNEKCSLRILNGVLGVLAQKSLSLRPDVAPGISGVAWFRSLVSSLMADKSPSHYHLDILSKIMALNSSILEPVLSKLFSWILSKPSKLSDEIFMLAYHYFLLNTLDIFAKLQRIHKLISKLLQTVSTLPVEVELSKLIPNAFLEKISVFTTLSASSHTIILLGVIYSYFEKSIDMFESENLNVSLLHAITAVLGSVLEGSRLLCFTIPRPVVSSFEEKFVHLSNLLARFGTLILMRTHDRRIMQPFLRTCYIWGEMCVMISCYGSEDSPPSLPKDSAPCDLSPLLNYISGDQWSVFAERITNFGDRQCNECLLKLVVQKLRVAKLSEERSQINVEATAKFIVAKLKSDIHGIQIFDIMQPEELGIILNSLPYEETKKFVVHFYSQISENEDEIIERWLLNCSLTDNKKFVVNIFEVSLKSLVNQPCKTNPHFKKLLEGLKKCELNETSNACLKTLINDALSLELNGCEEFPASDKVRKTCKLLSKFPLNYVAHSCGNVALTFVTGLMVALGEDLLPVFKGVVSATEDITASFDIVLLVLWLMTNIRDSGLRASAVELLIVKSTSSPSGLQQFKSLVSVIRKESSLSPPILVESKVHLYNCIRKCWGTGKRHAELNDVLGEQKKALTRSLKKTLKNTETEGNMWSWMLLDAYAIQIMIADRKGSLRKIVALNFNSFFKKALEGAKAGFILKNHVRQSCLSFLTTTLKCADGLRKEVNDSFVYTIFKELREVDCGDLWQYVCTAASEREFKKMMDDLLSTVKNSLRTPGHEVSQWDSLEVLPLNLRPLFLQKSVQTTSGVWSSKSVTIWKTFLLKSTGKKQKVCKEAVNELLKDPVNILPDPGDDGVNILNWFSFLQTCATSHGGALMTSSMHDYLLDIIISVDTSSCRIPQHFIASLDILSAIINPRSGYFKEKIHIVYQAFKKLLDWLITESDSTKVINAEQLSERALAGFHLEKWTSLLTKQDLGREVAFFITELIHVQTLVTIHPTVKIHIKNATFNLLTEADEHTVQYLMRVLPPGSQQIFSNIYVQYKRFYKFKGKV